MKLTNQRGADMILDCIGASYWEKNLRALAKDGQWILYGLLGGGHIDGNLFAGLLAKRAHLLTSTLRTRSDEVNCSLAALVVEISSSVAVCLQYKANLVKDFAREIVPLFDVRSDTVTLSGVTLRPVIDREFPLEQAAAAHRYLQENRTIGKVVLRVRDPDKDEL